MLEYLQLTIIGFSIVILTMTILTFILILISSLSKNKNKEKKEEEVKTEDFIIKVAKEEDDSKQVIAVITAAINEYARSQNKTLRIVSFKRASDKAPAWNKRSRINKY